MIDISDSVEAIYNGFDSNLVTIRHPFSVKENLSNLGYCYKSEKFYKVVVPLTGNDYVDDCLKMHEYGHIYLGHLDGIHEELDERLAQIINNKRSDLVETINENCNIDYADELLNKIIDNKRLNHMIHNVSMDMEINSSILNYDDCLLIQSTVRDIVFEEFKKFVNDKTGKEQNIPEELRKLFELKLISPRDFKFEEGLTYPDYLVQVLLNLDLFVNLLSNKFNSSNEGDLGEEQGEVVEGSGNSSDATNSKNIPKTLEEFLEMIGAGESSEGESDDSKNKDGDKGENSENRNDVDEKNEQKSDEFRIDKDHSNPSRDKSDKERNLGDYCNKGGNNRGLEKSSTVRNYNVNKDPLDMALEEIIRNVRQKVIKRDLIRDHVYKYNRKILGKTNYNILSPTYIQRVTRSEDPTIVYVIDVSGSMDTRLVDRIITTLRYFMKKLNSSLLYNIIAWDTELKQHYKNIGFSSPIPKLSCMGGTRLAGAFEFFKKEYGKEAVMVLISDFEDDLYEWNKIEMTMTGYSMYGLNYGRSQNYPKFKNFKIRECNQ